MQQSQLFGHTRKSVSADEVSVNAELLERAGFVNKSMAGVYSYLPLGLRTLKKIQHLIRQAMDELGGNEMLMPSLVPRENWARTGRLETYDALFEARGANDLSRAMNGASYVLGPTHEEVVTPLIRTFIQSYKDLPLAVYQIQTKFRNEPRAKSGLLRGREFSMKDMYSFHRDEADFQAFYERATEGYQRLFSKLGLNAILTEASGGAFSQYSHEFQVVTQNGEDLIYTCAGCSFAENREIATVKAGDRCPKCAGAIEEQKAIEVGNIFPLGTRFSDAFNLKYTDESGAKRSVIMGCYGIGPSRIMGALVEVHHDDHGIVWPASVAPFQVHLIEIHNQKSESRNKSEPQNLDLATPGSQLYQELIEADVEVLYDDRDVSAGQKFADADLIGIPIRIVLSDKTLTTDSVEWKARNSVKTELVKRSVLLKRIQGDS